MRYLLVILLFACANTNAAGYTGGVSTAAWFAANWFKSQPDNKTKETKFVEVKSDDIKPVTKTDSDSVAMTDYIKSCTELTHDVQLCKSNWIEARANGSEIVLVPFERTPQVRKAVDRQVTKVVRPEVTKEAKIEVTKTPKYVAESKVRGVNLLDVSNEEYKARRAAAMAKPDAVVIHDIIR